MKKLLLSAVALAAFSFTAQAQEMKFGVKAGVNFANFGGSDAGDAKSLTGFHAGALVEYRLTEQFSIQPEVIFSMQGAKTEYQTIDSGFNVVTVDSKTKLNYINFPIMAKYYVIEGLSIEAGPQVGFLMSADEEGEDAKDYYKSIDFGIAGGLAYDLDMGVFFQARYYAGLSKVSEDLTTTVGSVTTTYSPKVTNNVLSVSVGYKF